MIALRNLLLIVWGLACKACAWLQCLSVPCQCHRDTAANGEHTHAEQHTRPSRLWPEGPFCPAGMVWRAAYPPGRRATGRSLA